MKPILILLSLLFFEKSFGQSAENCGLDDDPFLTEQEAKFLNEYLNDVRGAFDFNSKKVIFITGNSGNRTGSKSEYFRYVREWKERYDKKIASWAIVFNEEEITDSGGYQAILTYWVKVLTKGREKKIIKKIQKQSNRKTMKQ